MLQFLKYVLASLVGLLLFFVLAFIIIAGLVASASSDRSTKIASNTVLKLSFDKPILERSVEDPLGDFEIPFRSSKQGIGLVELSKAIRNAQSDDRIKGIFLDLSVVNGGYASIEEIRNMLLDFKQSGKFITSYAENYSEGAYYLASVADRVYLNPLGMVEFNGLDSQMPFIKGTLEKLEVKPEIFRVGDFKSAIEPLILNGMSDSNRVQVSSYLNSIYNSNLQNIARSRNLDFAELRNISDKMLVKDAQDALRYKLVTDVGYFDQMEADMRSVLDIKEEGKIAFVTLNKYIRAEGIKAEQTGGDNRIAVIFATGEIQRGKGDDQTIGSESISDAIRKARLDKKVKAIVLRINSPGGDAQASDVMWREIQLARKVKPVIASMSDLAASGGYYMAMGCDTIVAQPNTITGSIGVFGVLFNAQDFLNHKLGVTMDGVSTGEHSNIGDFTRPLSQFERNFFQNQVNRIYEDFTSKAAQGRGMSQDQLKRLASGRVWSGAQAVENGLADKLGGLNEAILVAANAADIADSYRVRYYPDQKNFLETFMKGFGGDNESVMLKAYLGETYQYVKSMKDLEKFKGIQARLPYDMVMSW
jgi:protease IV